MASKTGSADKPSSCSRNTVSDITLQRHFESFPFFEFFKAAFTMGLIGLVVALLMIVHAFQNVGRFPLRIRQTPFD